MISSQDLNIIFQRKNIIQNSSKAFISLLEFECLLAEIAEISLRHVSYSDRLNFLLRKLSKAQQTINTSALDLYNIYSVEKKVPKGSISDRNLGIKRSIIKKDASQNKLFKITSHKSSKSSLIGNNSEAILKTLKSYEKTTNSSVAPTGKHTRASSIDYNMELAIDKLPGAYKNWSLKLEHAKKVLKKLKNKEYIKIFQNNAKISKTLKTKSCINSALDYLNNRRKSLYGKLFIIRLIFISWMNYTRQRKERIVKNN